MSVFGHVTRIVGLVAVFCGLAFAGTHASQFSGATNPHRGNAPDYQFIEHKSVDLPQLQDIALASSPTGHGDDAFLSSDLQTMPENKSGNLALPQLSSLTPKLPDRDKDASISSEPFNLPTMIAPPGETPAKWTELQSRILADEKALAVCLSNERSCSRAARRFMSIVEIGRKHEGRARLGWINRAVNLAIRPMSDWAQYGYSDYWASPLQTLNSQAGDCEDYAIVKYVALRHLGIAPNDLRLTIVHDSVLQAEHAVLAVRYGQTWVILDNRTMAMLDAEQVRHYIPLFAMDDRGARIYSTAVAHR
jgi:predicted transglutaminase-like cysteine proteinase